MEASLVSGLAAHGLPGLIILALGAWIVLLTRELREERKSRIDDSKGYAETMIAMQREVITATKALAEVNEDQKEREKEREREHRDQQDRERREREERDREEKRERDREPIPGGRRRIT